MNKTGIEWTNHSWNPTTGCSKASPGCINCYAERMSKRLAGRFGYPADEPFAVTLHPDRLDMPLRLRKPSRIFVDSMGDLFHKDVPFDFIRQVFATMWTAERHTFQVLTKRPRRMTEFMHWYAGRLREDGLNIALPLPNVWLGVSVEDQTRADERIPLLLQTPAAVRFLSIEPLLGPMDLRRGYVHRHFPDHITRDGRAIGAKLNIHWVIVGAETGPHARPCKPEWVESIIEQCRAAGAPVFVKDNVGWPERIQEFPDVR